jgi:acetyl esterase
LGSKDTHDRLIREIANGAKVAVVFVDFDHSPEVKYPVQRKEPYASPLQASLEQLKGLPPALVITDDADMLRDEGEAYAEKLAQAGVTVTQVRYFGTIHDFVILNRIAETPAVRGAIAQANDALRRALAKQDRLGRRLFAISSERSASCQ